MRNFASARAPRFASVWLKRARTSGRCDRERTEEIAPRGRDPGRAGGADGWAAGSIPRPCRVHPVPNDGFTARPAERAVRSGSEKRCGNALVRPSTAIREGVTDNAQQQLYTDGPGGFVGGGG